MSEFARHAQQELQQLRETKEELAIQLYWVKNITSEVIGEHPLFATINFAVKEALETYYES